MKKYTKVLSIAGSDSCGGAGIQADIKAVSACGCYAMTAVTAVTVQNTVGVFGIHEIPADIVKGQILAVYRDPGVDSAKTGMLSSAAIISAVADSIEQVHEKKLVVDPVMASTSGAVLLNPDADDTLINRLCPLAALVTPNIPEAEIILGKKISSADQMEDCARETAAKCRTAVLLKAGHLSGRYSADVLYDPSSGKISLFTESRVETRNSHGTGCTLSAAIAAFLGKGCSLSVAVEQAKKYISGALAAGKDYDCGAGHGPVHHFYRWWE